MRVLMVSDVYFPRVNGVSTSIQTFRRELAGQGVQVDLIAPDYPNGGGPHGEPDDENRRLFRIPSRYLAFDPEDRMMRRGWIARLLPQLRERDYALVHIQTPFVAHYAGLALARELAIPAISTYHTFFEEYLHHYARLLPAGLTRAFARRFSRGQCNATAGVIAPSGAMLAALRGYGVSVPIEVIPTGIPLDRFAGGDGKAFRQRHGIAAQREVALFVGRVAHEKHIDLLLRVAAVIRLIRPDFLLLIAGEGPALGALRAMAAEMRLDEHVQFVGYLARDGELLDCYRAADVFVFGSTTETQGLVLLEAMAMGLPVVAIPAMGAHDILAAEEGCLCARDDAEDFAEKLLRLLQQPALRQAMGSQARLFAQSWSAPVMAERLAGFYRRMLVGAPVEDTGTVPQAVARR